MTHLAQTFPVAILCVAAFTDLNETVTEEALEQEEIDKDETTHNPPATSRGEPITRSVSIKNIDRDILVVFFYERTVGDVYFNFDDVMVFT